MDKNKKRKLYPKIGVSSPYGNTSSDSTTQGVFDLFKINMEVLKEIIGLIPEAVQYFEVIPDVFIIEIGEADYPPVTNPECLRTLSNGTLAYMHYVRDDTDGFILRSTTSDVLEAAKLFVKEGGAALLLIAGTNYALLPLGEVAINRTVQ